MAEIKRTEDDDNGVTAKISGYAQAVLGEIETLAGVVNADMLAQEEGEFNVEVGTTREDLEEAGESEPRQ